MGVAAPFWASQPRSAGLQREALSTSIGHEISKTAFLPCLEMTVILTLLAPFRLSIVKGAISSQPTFAC
jgi:hypothetical protein